MSVSFVTSGSTQNTATTSSISQSFNIGTCDTVAFFIVVNTALTISVPQWNGVSCPAVASTSHDDGNAGEIEWCAMPAPATGTHTFTATISANSIGYVVGFASFNGGNQTGGATSYTNGATADNAAVTSSLSLSITTGSGDATVMGSAGGNTFAAAGSQTPTADWQGNTTGSPLGQGQHILSTGASDSYTSVLTAADAINMSGFRIKAAAGGTVVPVLDIPRRRFIRRHHARFPSPLDGSRKLIGWRLPELVVPNRKLILPKGYRRAA